MRGLSMLAILLFHTEVYFAERDLIPYDFYVANVLMAFFFLSGYVFKHPSKPFSARQKLRSVLHRIVIPYFFFTTILAFPKAFVHHQPVTDLLIGIVCGNGSWFVSALIVVELLMVVAVTIGHRLLFLLLPLTTFIIALALRNTYISDHYNYWNFHNAFVALPFFCLGMLYRKTESRLQVIFHPLLIVLYLAVIILLKFYEQKEGIRLIVEPVIFNAWPVFLIDMLTGILLLHAVCRWLPHLSFIEWVGRHSLVVYFFCGAVPTSVAFVLHHQGFFYDGQYWRVLIAFLMVCVASTAITWLCYRYLSFLKQK
jgi:fucose 4-O-acetylase-like acetyltransferase